MNEIMTGLDTSVKPKKNVNVKAETPIRVDNWTNYDKPLPSSVALDTTINELAFRLAIYLYGHSSHWIPRPSDIQKKLKWGRKKWAKASKGLRDAGYMQLLPTYGEDGKLTGSELRFSLHKNFPPLAKVTKISRVPQKVTLGEKELPSYPKSDMSTKGALYNNNNINNINTNNNYNTYQPPARPPSPTPVVVVSSEDDFKKVMDRVGKWEIRPEFVKEQLSKHKLPYLEAAIEYTEIHAKRNPQAYFANTCEKGWHKEFIRKAEEDKAKAAKEAKKLEDPAYQASEEEVWVEMMKNYDPNFKVPPGLKYIPPG